MDEGIAQAASERGHEDLATGLCRQVLGQPAEQDAGVGANAGLGIDLGFREVAQQLVVQQALRELVGQIGHERDGRTFGAMSRIDLTVASRMTGTTSEKPVSYRVSAALAVGRRARFGQILSTTVFWSRRST